MLINHAEFPGITAVLDANYTCSHGAAPGSGTMTVPPDLTRLREVGELILFDGEQMLRLKDCKVVRPMGSVGPGGQTITLLLFDRRWKWEFAKPISGRYNQPQEQTQAVTPTPRPGAGAGNPPGPPVPIAKGAEPVKPRSKKTARELAELCLKALGEKRYDVQALDDKATPTVDWDYVNPALALQALAEDLGCRLMYRPVQDDVVIAKLGEGQPLPDGAYLTDSLGLEVKPRPDKIKLYGARTRVQMRFSLEAVGVDFDGAIYPIGDLSYKPTNGWQHTGPPYANLPTTGLPDGFTRQDAQALATESIYRYYRIRAKDAAGENVLEVPPNDKSHWSTKRIDQIHLLTHRNETTKDGFGRLSYLPAICYGKHVPPHLVTLGGQHADLYQATNARTPVKVPFSIDAERQLVIFSKAVFAVIANGRIDPAEIVLETTCEFTANDTDQYERWSCEYKMQTTSLEAGTATIIREDVVYQIIAKYKTDTNEFDFTTDNRKATEPRADYYLKGEAKRYDAAESRDTTYPGIRLDISLDGAIQQITWSIGGGPVTRVSRNGEHALYLPSYEARRRIQETNPGEMRRRSERIVDLRRRLGIQPVG